MRIEYDPESPCDTGEYQCPSCNLVWFGNGNALHAKICPDRHNGYQNSIFTFGPRQIEKIKKWARLYGDNTPYHNVSLNMLREQWPHLLESEV